jgi:hypothetical protein
MDNWIDKTFWVKVEQGDQIHYQAVVSDDVDETILDLAGEGEAITAIKAQGFDQCRACEHMESCMGSVWNEGLRMGGPSQDAPDSRISMVHTCITCTEKTLTDCEAEGGQRIVPDSCPRWTPKRGSAMDCDGCQTEKEMLRALHPSYTKSSETLLGDWQEFCDLIRSGDDLAKRRHTKNLVQKMRIGGHFPDFPKFDQVRLIRAQWVLGSLLEDIRIRFQREWFKMGAQQESSILSDWLERIYLSLGRHPDDPAALVHEFILLFNDCQPFRMVWVQMVLARRKFLERIWVGLVQSVRFQSEIEEDS